MQNLDLPNGLLNGNSGSLSGRSTPNYGSFSRWVKKTERTVTKDGVCNFHNTHVAQQKTKYFWDLFTTMLELKWRWILTVFTLAYFGSWLVFAAIWYLILYEHGDTQHFDDTGWKPCVTGIQNFTSAFLFSIETQQTTGYGFYHLTEECQPAILLFGIQSIIGVILEGLLVGLVFTKISRAKQRSQTLMFSKNAVISARDGVLYFMFRIGDMRRSHLLEARVRAQLIKKRTTQEGEVITYHQEELQVGGDGEMGDRVLLFWPTTVVHRITKDSPLHHLTSSDLHPFNTSFEIIVVLEGIVESTGLTTQARSSYLPSEILWGQRFECVVSKKSSSGERIIDYSLFNATVSCFSDDDDLSPSTF